MFETTPFLLVTALSHWNLTQKQFSEFTVLLSGLDFLNTIFLKKYFIAREYIILACYF